MAAAVKTRVSSKVMGRLRLASHGLLVPGFDGVPEAVRGMGAIQAQDLQSALWAVGVRVPGAGLSDVRRALDDGAVVRSWPMRGTLHLLAPEDLQWILNITTARMVQGTAGRHRQLEITSGDVEKCREVALGVVDGGRAASREELFAAFEAAGQATKAQRGIHLLWMLCQSASLVLGPLESNQQKFVAFDRWITSSRDLGREKGIAELLLRYLRGHGPATLRDFAWWSSIPLTEVRRALPEVSGELVELEHDGTQYWLSPEAAALLDDGVPGQRTVLALPGFDEFVLGYTDRSIVLPPEHAQKIVPGGNGVFKKAIVAGGEVTGTWARQGNGQPAAVVPVPFDDTKPLGPAALAGFRRAAERYGRFLAS
jgi:hypothetical protein